MALLPGHVIVETTVDGRLHLLCTLCRTYMATLPRRPTLADLLFEMNEHRCAQ